jgi:hypothetical protein
MRHRMTAVESDTRRSLGGWVRVAAVWCAGVALAASSVRAAQGRGSATSPGTVARHEHPLRAVQLLEYRPTGSDARVRFEWDQVSGAREYRLVGRWTGTVSWVVRRREYSVTARTATSWSPQRVTYEVVLPLGNHSWRLVGLFGPNDARIVGDSTPLSFAVR